MGGLEEALAEFYVPLAVGWAYGRLRRGEAETAARALSGLLVNALLPALIFASLCGRRAAALTVPVVASLVVVVSAAAARLLLRSPELVITAMYPNTGYLPIPLAYAVWGEDGVAYAALYVLGNNPTANTLAPILTGGDWRSGLRRASRFPPVYAAAAALMVNLVGARVPEPVLAPLRALGFTAPTLALVLLGMEFARAGVDARDSVSVYALRLLLAVPTGLALASAMGLEGLPLKVVALELLMPPAVSSVALVSELGMDSARVAGIVVSLTVLVTVVVVPLYLLLAA